MNDIYYFSAGKVGFYPLSLKCAYDAAGTWPDDLVEISTEDYQDLISNQPIDKMLGSDSEGYPVWVDAPLPTKAQCIYIAEMKKESLLNEATSKITIWKKITDW